MSSKAVEGLKGKRCGEAKIIDGYTVCTVGEIGSSYRTRKVNPMAKKLDPKELVSFEELLSSNTTEQETLINLLEKKGIIAKAELLEEIERLQKKKFNRKGYEH